MLVTVSKVPTGCRSNQSRFRWSLEGRFAARIRTAIELRELHREEKFVRHVSHRTGFAPLNLRDLRNAIPEEKRETLFILGSGSSILEHRSNHFEILSGGTSIGINAWVLHSFVPDIYTYEPVPNDQSDHYKTLSHLHRSDIVSRIPRILILRPRNSVETSQLEQIPVELRTRTFLYGRVNPYTRKRENLPGDLSRLIEFMSRRSELSSSVDSGATIVRMAVFGLLMGYSEIVFVGVDLNHTRYFWEIDTKFLAAAGLSSFDSEQTGEVHETNMEGFAPFRVTEAIQALTEVAAKQFGTEFYVGSPKSELAKFLNTYPRFG